MLRQLRRVNAKSVIIHKIDRAARNPKDWAMFSELPDIGVDVFVATESLDFNLHGGRLTADIQAVIAADYIRNLREVTVKDLTGGSNKGSIRSAPQLVTSTMEEANRSHLIQRKRL